MALLKTYTEIRCFTGMTGFFRRFIKGYSKIAKPLNDLLEGEASKVKAEEVDYGEPVRCNLVDISNVPPGTITDHYPPEGCEGDNLVPGCSLQYGLDLTVYLAIIDNAERMRGACGSTSKCSWSNDSNTGCGRNIPGMPELLLGRRSV